RGNHEVMTRGTFANTRLRNHLAPGTEGGFTLHLPDEDPSTIYDAAMRYAADGVPLVVLEGKAYGTGSSRDWSAKGTRLLGVRAVIAESFERIHRSNLVGMGVLPLQFGDGDTAESLGIDGHELFTIGELAGNGLPSTVDVTAEGPERAASFTCRVRIDTPTELDYYRHGGILQYVVHRLATTSSSMSSH